MNLTYVLNTIFKACTSNCRSYPQSCFCICINALKSTSSKKSYPQQLWITMWITLDLSTIENAQKSYPQFALSYPHSYPQPSL